MTNKRITLLPPTLDASTYLHLLKAGDEAPRQAFLRSFGYRLPPIARQLAVTQRELSRLTPFMERTERNATIHMFLHAAFNNVYTSTLLLIEGYPLASGFLMRHYAEASSMALLILDNDPSVWLRYDSETAYPVQKAPHRLLQKATAARLRILLDFDVKGWKRFLTLTRFYDKFSHASGFSLSFHMMFNQPGVYILGAEFDPGKRRQLSKELRLRRSALRPLAALARATRRILKTRP